MENNIEDVSEEYLRGFIEGFRETTRAIGERLCEHPSEEEHNPDDYTKKQISEMLLEAIKPEHFDCEKTESKEYVKGYKEGYKEAFDIITEDLCDEAIEGYTLIDYGKDYVSHAEDIEIEKCLNCREPKDECGHLGMFCPLLLYFPDK